MPLDTQSAAAVQMLDAIGASTSYKLPLAEFRASVDAMLGDLSVERAGLAGVEDRTVLGPAGPIPVRIYRPADAGAGALPLLLYFHGGGFVIGTLDGYDGVCCQLTKLAGCVTVSVDYRLAPEHPFPAAPDDCEAVLIWAAQNAAALGVDPARIVVGGDSAGGNLAAVTALRSLRNGGPAVALQLLVYPVTDIAGHWPSHERNGSGYFLTKEIMDWFMDQYLPAPLDRNHPDASVFHATGLAGLPPAVVLTAEFDPLVDEGEAYARKLQEAGVPVTLTRYEGTIHAFLGMYPMIDQGRVALAQCAEAIRAL